MRACVCVCVCACVSCTCCNRIPLYRPTSCSLATLTLCSFTARQAEERKRIQLEQYWQIALQLEQTSGESIAIMRNNLERGKKSVDYFLKMWKERIEALVPQDTLVAAGGAGGAGREAESPEQATARAIARQSLAAHWTDVEGGGASQPKPQPPSLAVMAGHAKLTL